MTELARIKRELTQRAKKRFEDLASFYEPPKKNRKHGIDFSGGFRIFPPGKERKEAA